ncbi:hypothetical protein CRUP_029047 [Coryphaenoides rupestris]|nr:hypothetical protein CRUP_029047 [Coryphaenoides rupestris]
MEGMTSTRLDRNQAWQILVSVTNLFSKWRMVKHCASEAVLFGVCHLDGRGGCQRTWQLRDAGGHHAMPSDRISSDTWQLGARLHAVRLLAIAQPADVEAQRLDVVDALGHHQVLLHQWLAHPELHEEVHQVLGGQYDGRVQRDHEAGPQGQVQRQAPPTMRPLRMKATPSRVSRQRPVEPGSAPRPDARSGSCTWQLGARLHAVRLLAIAQPADVEAQRLDVVDALGHHQVLLHQWLAHPELHEEVHQVLGGQYDGRVQRDHEAGPQGQVQPPPPPPPPYFGGEVAVEAGPSDDEAAEDEGDAQQGEQAAARGARLGPPARRTLGLEPPPAAQPPSPDCTAAKVQQSNLKSFLELEPPPAAQPPSPDCTAAKVQQSNLKSFLEILVPPGDAWIPLLPFPTHQGLVYHGAGSQVCLACHGDSLPTSQSASQPASQEASQLAARPRRGELASASSYTPCRIQCVL